MYYIHIVKRFRAHCGFYAIENKLLLLLLDTRPLEQNQRDPSRILTIHIHPLSLSLFLPLSPSLSIYLSNSLSLSLCLTLSLPLSLYLSPPLYISLPPSLSLSLSLSLCLSISVSLYTVYISNSI